MDKLNIFSWNAQGLYDKLFDFYFHLIKNNVDIACVYETFLKPNVRLHNHPDYKCYRLDRQNHGGGVAIFIRRTITHEAAPNLKFKLLECIGVIVKLSNSSSINIYSIYLPGSASNELIRQHYQQDIRKLTSLRFSYYACGDFNSKHRHWNCTRANTAGKILYDEYINHDFIIAFPPTHTYFPDDPNRQASTLDLVLTNYRHSMTEPSCLSLSSDHRSFMFKVHLSERFMVNNPRLIRCYKKANWDLYRYRVTINLGTQSTDVDNIRSTEQIDRMIEKITNVLLEAENLTVPLVRPDPYFVQLTPVIEEMFKLSHVEKRRWQRLRNRFHLVQSRRLSKLASSMINEIRNINWGHRMENLEDHGDRRQLWQIAKFCRNKCREIPPLKNGAELYVSAAEKAEHLASAFESFHQNPLNNNNAALESRVDRTVAVISSGVIQPDSINFPTPEELLTYTRHLKNMKAPGIDQVRNILIKQAPFQAIKYLNVICCACLKLGYFPKQWKHAQVVPINKPGKDPTDCGGYRPISLLPVLSKLLERVILVRFTNFLEENNILPEQQYGFRAKRSTTHQLKRVKDLISNGLAQKQSTGMIMFDIQKAFDQVWHNGLLYKLHNINLPLYLTKIIASFLLGRSFVVSVNGKISSIKHIPFGVPQGAVLSPTLYCTYTHDIPQNHDSEVAVFADDTAIMKTARLFSQIRNSLQSTTAAFTSYFQRWKITVNPTKTQLVYFTKRRTRQVPNAPFNFQGHNIDWESEGKYLGLNLDKRLTMKSHVDKVIGKTQAVVKLLYPMISRRSKMSIKNKIHMYKVGIRPVFTYGCPIFHNMAACHYKRLQTQQNRILKMMLKLPWRYPTADLHEIAEVETVYEYCTRLKTKFDSSHSVS